MKNQNDKNFILIAILIFIATTHLSFLFSF